jgi:methylisocitrate lyase
VTPAGKRWSGLEEAPVQVAGVVAEEARRFTAAIPLPLLVDADTGWGPRPMVERTVRELERAGAAAIQLEDQVADKRCGHRPNKRLAPSAEMEQRIAAAVGRAGRYVAAGADIIFLEGTGELRQYSAVAAATGVPVLANLTEFGVLPDMQTRADLYDVLDYEAYERQADLRAAAGTA